MLHDAVRSERDDAYRTPACWARSFKHLFSPVGLAQQPRWAFEYSIDRDTPVAVAQVKEGSEKVLIAYIAEGPGSIRCGSRGPRRQRRSASC